MCKRNQLSKEENIHFIHFSLHILFFRCLTNFFDKNIVHKEIFNETPRCSKNTKYVLLFSHLLLNYKKNILVVEYVIIRIN